MINDKSFFSEARIYFDKKAGLPENRNVKNCWRDILGITKARYGVNHIYEMPRDCKDEANKFAMLITFEIFSEHKATKMRKANILVANKE